MNLRDALGHATNIVDKVGFVYLKDDVSPWGHQKAKDVVLILARFKTEGMRQLIALLEQYAGDVSEQRAHTCVEYGEPCELCERERTRMEAVRQIAEHGYYDPARRAET